MIIVSYVKAELVQTQNYPNPKPNYSQKPVPTNSGKFIHDPGKAEHG